MAAALIVIDLIEDYFDASMWPQSAIPGDRVRLAATTNELVRICRSRDMPVIWVRQEFEPDGSNVFRHMRDRGQRYAIRGTPGSRLLPELEVRPGDQVVAKHRFSAFFETPLAGILADRGIDTVILAGITTAWCIRSTTTDAYQMDLTVILAKDCMQAFTIEAHEASLRAMDGYIAHVMSNEDIASSLPKG